VLGARGHALPELRREALKGLARQPERAQPVVREGDRQRGCVGGVQGGGGGGDVGQEPLDEPAAGVAVVDAQQQIRAGVR